MLEILQQIENSKAILAAQDMCLKLQRQIHELEERVKKLEAAQIADVADTYKKGSGRYL